jgi:hypothetical protein
VFFGAEGDVGVAEEDGVGRLVEEKCIWFAGEYGGGYFLLNGFQGWLFCPSIKDNSSSLGMQSSGYLEAARRRDWIECSV